MAVDLLEQGPAEGDVENLDAAANAEHGQPAQACIQERELELIIPDDSLSAPLALEAGAPA